MIDWLIVWDILKTHHMYVSRTLDLLEFEDDIWCNPNELSALSTNSYWLFNCPSSSNLGWTFSGLDKLHNVASLGEEFLDLKKKRLFVGDKAIGIYWLGFLWSWIGPRSGSSDDHDLRPEICQKLCTNRFLSKMNNTLKVGKLQLFSTHNKKA